MSTKAIQSCKVQSCTIRSKLSKGLLAAIKAQYAADRDCPIPKMTGKNLYCKVVWLENRWAHFIKGVRVPKTYLREWIWATFKGCREEWAHIFTSRLKCLKIKNKSKNINSRKSFSSSIYHNQTNRIRYPERDHQFGNRNKSLCRSSCVMANSTRKREHKLYNYISMKWRKMLCSQIRRTYKSR